MGARNFISARLNVRGLDLLEILAVDSKFLMDLSIVTSVLAKESVVQQNYVSVKKFKANFFFFFGCQFRGTGTHTTLLMAVKQKARQKMHEPPLQLLHYYYPTTMSVETESRSQEPLDLVRYQLDETVLVKLRGAREMKGKLQGYDSHCNMVISEAEEYIYEVNGSSEPIVKKTEMVFVRGDSVILISPIN